MFKEYEETVEYAERVKPDEERVAAGRCHRDYERKRLVEIRHAPDESLAPRVQFSCRLREKPHRAQMPAEEASLECGEDEKGNPQQHQPSEPLARSERAEETQDGADSRQDRGEFRMRLGEVAKREDRGRSRDQDSPDVTAQPFHGNPPMLPIRLARS